MGRLDTEVLVIGTGPGGATLARELANQGRNVLMVERGRWHRLTLGHYLSVGTINRLLVPRGEFGLMARGVTVGGSTVVFTGNAYDPPEWLEHDLGIDLSNEILETRREIGIKPLPAEFFQKWPGTKRLMDAAGELGLTMKPQEKYINADKCDPACDHCMLGCRRGAKWTAREYVTQALAKGAKLLDLTTVRRLIVEEGRVKGAVIGGFHGFDEIRAEKVVLAAGGMGTPVILMNSGFKDAGDHFFIDPMNVVVGLSRYPGSVGEQTFSTASVDFLESDEFMIGNLGDLCLYHFSLMGQLRGYKPGHAMGLFAKLGDSAGGTINSRGVVHKPYTEEDRAKFRKGTAECKKIMIKAGVAAETIVVLPNVGGHPGGTAAIGRVVDSKLKALALGNLYVCDASVFPRSPGRPPSLTIIALAKRLAKTI